MGNDEAHRSGLDFVIGLRCLRCGREYAVDEIEYVCACRSNQGSDMGSLDVVYDYRGNSAGDRPGAFGR